MSLVRFDLPTVTVKQSFIVSQIDSCTVEKFDRTLFTRDRSIFSLCLHETLNG